ncbi:hypothetical protein AYI68_g2853, partial [Smittium mucronatum]
MGKIAKPGTVTEVVKA